MRLWRTRAKSTHCGKKIAGIGTTYYWRGEFENATLQEYTIQAEDAGERRRCSRPRTDWMELWCMSCAQKYGIVW